MSHKHTLYERWKDKEWSMGNGQCPECQGLPPSWHGHPCALTSNKIGHKPDCLVALTIEAFGGAVIRLGDYRDPREFECFIDGYGFYDTRVKEDLPCAE